MYLSLGLLNLVEKNNLSCIRSPNVFLAIVKSIKKIFLGCEPIGLFYNNQLRSTS